MECSKTSHNTHGKILVVDDNDATRYTLSRHLKHAGYDVLEAGTGGEGLRLAQALMPDVILLDVGLPDISGLEVCRDLKRNPVTASSAVIQVSAAFTTSDDRVRGLEGGADSYLAQPFEPRVLLAEIAAVMRVHHAEERLRKAKQAQETAFAQLDAVIEGMADGLVLADLRGEVLRVNAAAARIIGFDGGAPVSAFAREYLDQIEVVDLEGNNVPRESWPLYRATRGEVVSGVELRVRHRTTGREFVAAYSANQVKDSAGAPILVVLIIRDVTEQKRAQEALARAEAQLRRQAQSLEKAVAARTAELQETNKELESFCYSLSHDMRAPLRAIRSYTEVVLRDCTTQLPVPAKTHLQKVTAAASRLDQLIQDVVAFTQLSRQPLELGRVNPEGIVREIVAQDPSLQAPNAEVTVRGTLPAVKAQATLLAECLGNLLSNAVKFVPPGTQPRVEVYGERLGGKVRLWVRDNGIGIEKTAQERIFGLFERGHRAEQYGGTGVGLAVVRRAAARMGGSVGLESEPGRGSRFWIELPGSE